MEEGDVSENHCASIRLSLTPVAHDLQSASGNLNDEIHLRTKSGAFLEICGIGLSRPSVFNQASGGYETLVKLTSAVPFVIKPSQVTFGPAAGTQGLILQRTGHFRFLDLPVEIRSMIFEYVVVVGFPIKLGVTIGSRIAQVNERKGLGDQIQDATCLLLVSRQVHDEVIPILYGSNTFALSAHGLRLLLDRNAETANCIGRPSLSLYATRDSANRFGPLMQNYAVRTIRYSLTQLQRLSAVRTIRLDHKLIYHTRKYWDHVDLVNLCVPMLNGIYRQRQKKGIKTKIEDVLDMNHEDCDWSVRGCADFNKQVKREVAKRFLIDDEDEN